MENLQEPWSQTEWFEYVQRVLKQGDPEEDDDLLVHQVIGPVHGGPLYPLDFTQ